jgi:hypothetical protein
MKVCAKVRHVEARMELGALPVENDFAPRRLARCASCRSIKANWLRSIRNSPDARRRERHDGPRRAAHADLTASALAKQSFGRVVARLRGGAAQGLGDARRELRTRRRRVEEHPPAWRARFQLALARRRLSSTTMPRRKPRRARRWPRRRIKHAIAGALDRGAHCECARRRRPCAHDARRTRRVRTTRRRRGPRRKSRRSASGAPPASCAAVDAVEPLEALRFRWRGDATELAVVGMLGDSLFRARPLA